MKRPWLVIGEGISLAHVSRALLVSQALQRLGEQVIFSTSRHYTGWSRQRGQKAVDIYTPDPRSVYARLRRLQPMLTTSEVEASVKADLELIKQTNPVGVIGDCRNSLRISTHLSRTPYVALTNTNCTPWYAGPLVIPIAACSNHKLRHHLENHTPAGVIAALHTVGCRRLARPFQKAARSLGAKIDCSDFRTVFTSDDLTLLLDDPGFNPARQLPDHVKFTGPLWIPADELSRNETEQALAKLDHRPLVVISTGSTGSANQLSSLILHLESRGWNTFLLGKAAMDVPHFSPSRRIQLPFADPATLLPHAQAVISHGGNGTTYQAIEHQKPVFGLPTFFDQQTQCKLTQRAGVGGSLWGMPVAKTDELIHGHLNNHHATSQLRSLASRLESPSSHARTAATQAIRFAQRDVIQHAA